MTAESHFVLSVIILVLVAVVQENKIVFSVSSNVRRLFNI